MSNLSQEPREKLREILAKNGDSLLQDSDRCEGLLKDHCPEFRREISALVGALEERVPMELKSSWQSSMTPEAMRARMVQRLEEHRGLAHDVAEWAVDSWSHAVGVGLGRSSDQLDSVAISGGTRSEVWESAKKDPAEFGLSQQTGPAPAPTLTSRSNGNKLLGAAFAAALVVGVLGYTGKLPFKIGGSDGGGQVPCADGPASANCVGPIDGKDQGKQSGQGNGGQGQSGGQGNGGQAGNGQGQNGNGQGQGQNGGTGTATNGSGGSAGTGAAVAHGTVTALNIAVAQELNSDEATPGQLVQGSVKNPVIVDGKVVLPAGTKAMLQVTEVEQAGKLAGSAHISLAVVELNIGGKMVQVQSTPHIFKGPSKTAATAKKTGILAGIGCGAGAAVGRLFKKTGTGCGAGAAAGGATGVALSATDKPKPAKLAAGTTFRYVLTPPLNL